MNPENIHINSLWIGSTLSNIELLTLKSFVSKGHIFNLWVYEKPDTIIPDGVILHDANKIIPSDKIFRYKYKNQFGHGKGSLGGFSDIFRYKLLYEYGGWWTDMDVTCLKPLDLDEPYVFRTHQILNVVGNIMKCPKGSELMKLCYEEASNTIKPENRDWHKPIQILNDFIFKLELSEYILHFSNPDSWRQIRKWLNADFSPPSNWYVVHWVNEEWRRNRLDKNYYKPKSFLGHLMLEAGIQSVEKSVVDKISESVKMSYPYAALMQMPSFVKSLFST